MPLKLPLPIIYPITSGTTTSQTTPNDPQFADILRLVQAAVDAEVTLFQIREKSLPDGVLHELTSRAVEITRGSATRLIVNSRLEIAWDAGADGAHLSFKSFMQKCGGAWTERAPGVSENFLIGVSTHYVSEAEAASILGADFVVFGPIFDTESKRAYGPPQGLSKLREVVGTVDDIPVIAIGGITLANVTDCFKAGVSGVAAIRLFNDANTMTYTVKE
ncbi:MAG TPA: thiamine phosphate synthase, partial [Pyrinomonadaceae bacterium]|nr:thiamine phosphate synthase [Pyrinomonadaceae bacterium]